MSCKKCKDIEDNFSVRCSCGHFTDKIGICHNCKNYLSINKIPNKYLEEIEKIGLKEFLRKHIDNDIGIAIYLKHCRIVDEYLDKYNELKIGLIDISMNIDQMIKEN